MARPASKSVAITVAAGVLTFGVQQLTAGETIGGGLAIVIGLGVFFGYQIAEDKDHAKAYDDVIDAVGEDTIKRLSELGADELEAIIQNHRNGGDE